MGSNTKFNYVYKDKIELVFNYREGTETVPFDRLISVSDTYIDTPPWRTASFPLKYERLFFYTFLCGTRNRTSIFLR